MDTRFSATCVEYLELCVSLQQLVLILYIENDILYAYVCVWVYVCKYACAIIVVTAAFLVETFSVINRQYLSYKNVTTELSVGPSIKYVTLEGGGVQEGVTVLWQGQGMSQFKKIIHMKPKIESDAILLSYPHQQPTSSFLL